MDTRVLTLGRIVFGIPFVLFGLLHFINNPDLTGVVPDFMPGPAFWVYITGVALVVGGSAIVVNQYTKTGGYLIAALMFLFVILLHIPGMFDEATMQMAMNNFFKDFALGGGALIIAGLSPNEYMEGSEI
ncbi:MAG: DoxX family protein [Balneolales bacterium]